MTCTVMKNYPIKSKKAVTRVVGGPHTPNKEDIFFGVLTHNGKCSN